MNESELWTAAKQGDVKILQRAISNEDVSWILTLQNPEGDSLAHIAARKGHLQFLQLLSESGFNLESTNKRGRTLVHEATQNTQLVILKYLRSQEVDFNTLTNNGDSCLDLAKKPDILSYLESVIYSDQPSSSGSGRKGKTKKSKGGRGRLSELKEVKKSTGVIIPNSTAISRTGPFHQSGHLSFPICQLDQVGWQNAAELDTLGFPKRPDWRTLGLLSAEALHSFEERNFQQWIEKINSCSEQISTFERNLEYWRELWRVLERGDLCLIIVDCRNPLLHLSRVLLNYLMNELNMKCIVCLNKADLVHATALEAWTQYLTKTLDVEVVLCSCKDSGESRSEIFSCILRQEVASSPSRSIQEAVQMDCVSLIKYREVQSQTTKRTRRVKVQIESSSSSCSTSEEDEMNKERIQKPIVLSIIGEPNVGKSSVVNYLLGVKKVGVSSHPGRTKHLQTHLLCPGLMLCDCPGIVFPKINVPFPMQTIVLRNSVLEGHVLFGCFPIARCQDVYSVVEFLAQYISPPLPKLLGIESASSEHCLSVLEICEQLAMKHNWMTHKGGRLDIYRAANTTLRNALAGREGLVLQYWPPEHQ